MKLLTIARKLRAFGYLGPDVDPKYLLENASHLLIPAIGKFLEFHGVPTDALRGVTRISDLGAIVKIVYRLLTEPRCGCPDTEALGGSTNRWDVSQMPIKVFIDPLPGMSQADWTEAIDTALKAWMSVADIAYELTNDRSKANTIIVDASIDGPGNVLADMEMPYGIQRQRPLRFRVDRELWDLRGRAPRLNAVAMSTHEFGHNGGVSHIPVARGTALMNPMLNPRVWTPQPLDIAAMVGLYGPPRSQPTPLPIPAPQPPAGSGSAVGTSYVIRVTGDVTVDNFRLLPKTS